MAVVVTMTIAAASVAGVASVPMWPAAHVQSHAAPLPPPALMACNLRLAAAAD